MRGGFCIKKQNKNRNFPFPLFVSVCDFNFLLEIICIFLIAGKNVQCGNEAHEKYYRQALLFACTIKINSVTSHILHWLKIKGRRRRRKREKSSQAHHQVKLLKQIIDNTKVSQFSHTKKNWKIIFCVQFLMQQTEAAHRIAS